VRLISGLRRPLAALSAYDVLVISAGIWFLGKFLRYAFPPLFGQFQGTYGVSNAEVGLAYTGFMAAYALMQFPSGVIADYLGSVQVIVGGALVAAVGALAVGPAPGFLAVAVAMVVMGIGTGVHKTVAVGLLARAYPGQTGRALGAFDTAGTYGGVVAPLAVTAVITTPALTGLLPVAAWRGLFVYSGLLGIGLAVAFATRSRTITEEPASADKRPGARAYLAVFANRRFLAFVVLSILFGFAYNGLVAFLPLYLTDIAGLTPATASLLYSLLFVVSVVQLVSGSVSDRLGRLPVIVGTLVLAGVGLGGLLLAGAVGPLVAGGLVIAIGVGAHGFRPVRGAYLTELLPKTVAGGGLGAVRTLLMGAGAISPGVVGVLADRVGFQAGFWLLAAALVGTAVIAVGLWMTGPD